MKIHIKRIYEAASPADGYRILVDRLWPRGLKKEDARIDLWAKDIAPTTELRKWFNHEADKWTAFKAKYHTELNHSPQLPEFLTELKKHKAVTFLIATRNEQYNHALVLKNFVEEKIK